MRFFGAMLIRGVLLLCVFAGVMPAAGLGSVQAQSSPTTGENVAARDAFERTLAADPHNLAAQEGEVQVSERLALAARAAGDKDTALTALLRAQKFAPENARLLYDLGILEDEMRLYRDADLTLAHLWEIDTTNPKVLYAVARVKLDLGQLAPAEENMKAYLEVKPNDPTAHYALGRIYQEGLQFDKAKAEFERSIQLQPVQTEAYYQVGDIAIQQHNYAEALANFDKTLSRNPRHGGALAGSGIACFKLKQYEKAEEFLDKAISAAPDYQPGHYYLGLTLARLGKKTEAEREFSVATQLANQDNSQGANRLRLVPPTESR
ncbi:tetratricopeptide repeat protein [Edaphobacter paludis]|uniref:Tetratricopeptide repeat protein n=1 Tax=Edaphobacter paludis TaxID=3035702 RepID=A0AAU7CW39_9BACT